MLTGGALPRIDSPSCSSVSSATPSPRSGIGSLRIFASLGCVSIEVIDPSMPGSRTLALALALALIEKLSLPVSSSRSWCIAPAASRPPPYIAMTTVCWVRSGQKPKGKVFH